MKNIHVLPTDKPSSLFITEGRLFNYHKPQQGDGVKIINQNIYITNSEEIKQGDYGLVVNEILSYNKMIELWGLTQGWKIILTDNKDLIKDGVQVIDDEFLEWFVNNPSCERIEVNGISDVALGGFADVCYKIIIPRKTQQIINEDYAGGLEMGQIIPKEEAKPETQGYICPQTKKQCDDECCVSAEDCHIEASFGIISDCEPTKQETLEEAVQKVANSDDFINGALFGSLWQQERMYSEEEVRQMIF